jgi:hypothetical protein
MFEKEAEEYSRNFDWTNDDRIIDYSERGFKDGAEFGYNKAKEDADIMKSRFLELCNLKDMRIEELEKANEYAKTIVKDLLNNSDEYARERAINFLEEKK